MNKKIYNLAIRKRGECLLNKIRNILLQYIYIYNKHEPSFERDVVF